MNGFPLLRPMVHALPPESAHALAITALAAGVIPAVRRVDHPALAVQAFGYVFPNPIGLAAGFDKNADVCDAALALGFGFVEAGTVTPKPQPGNLRPRLFRLTEDEAVINRLGFNNKGLEYFVANLKRRRRHGIVGANIGKNKESLEAAHDYVAGLRAVYPHADYITVNISSPNTPDLRSLQKRAALDALLSEVCSAREKYTEEHGRRLPLLVKVAPDLDQKEKEDIVDKAIEYCVDGLIVSNTTISRPPLQSRYAAEVGGLSGRPLFTFSTQALKDFYQISGGQLVLVGAGGIFSAEDAYQKIRAGASLVQLYTALVYRGFGVVAEIERGLLPLLQRDGFSHISEALGADVKR